MPTKPAALSEPMSRPARGGARRGAGRTARGDTAERQARILAEATRLFARAGFDATTTAEIARRAGVSEGTLFHHYPSKRALLAAIAERGAREILGAAFAGIDPERDAPDIEAIARRLVAFAREHEDLYRVFRMGRGSEPPDASFALEQGEDRMVAATADALARWSARGLLRPLRPRLAAELVFAQFDALVRYCVLLGNDDDEDACIAEFVRSLTGALTEPS
ncbi:MAG: helix-turn-helix domain-containing protein [Myxococcota bacterium]|nr:helix-turn-helix domain-containing protein [Myxococcota bacterium]